MSEVEKLLNNVELLRNQLDKLIQDKNCNLLDSEVILASKILDVALNQYNKFIKGKIEKFKFELEP